MKEQAIQDPPHLDWLLENQRIADVEQFSYEQIALQRNANRDVCASRRLLGTFSACNTMRVHKQAKGQRSRRQSKLNLSSLRFTIHDLPLLPRRLHAWKDHLALSHYLAARRRWHGSRL